MQTMPTLPVAQFEPRILRQSAKCVATVVHVRSVKHARQVEHPTCMHAWVVTLLALAQLARKRQNGMKPVMQRVRRKGACG